MAEKLEGPTEAPTWRFCDCSNGRLISAAHAQSGLGRERVRPCEDYSGGTRVPTASAFPRHRDKRIRALLGFSSPRFPGPSSKGLQRGVIVWAHRA